MMFVEWLKKMERDGWLARTNRPDCVCRPYTSKVGFGIKYQRLLGNAETKGIVCRLSFDQYLTLAYDAGITNPNQIGTSMKSFQMGRVGDVGDYIYGKCRFIPRTQNMQERTDNGGSKRQADKIRGLKNPSKGIVHKGKSNYRFSGYYITTKGEFVTVEEAAAANGCGTMTVYDRCKKCDRVINKYATSTLKTLGAHTLGKTYRELGWWFKEV